MKIYNWLIISILLILWACTNEAKTDKNEDCPYGSPTAIFNKDNLSDYHFEVKNLNSTEQGTLADGVRVTFFQSGCEKVNRTFQFEFPTNDDVQQPDSVWVQQTALALKNMADNTLDPAGSQFFQAFSQDLYLNAAYVSFDRPLSLADYQAGMFFVLRKIVSTTQAIVILEIKQGDIDD